MLQVSNLTNAVVDSTIAIYNSIRAELLPTPSKPHYTFNLRDVARVIQGVMRADGKTTAEPKDLTALWVHESSRVFADRLVTHEDHAAIRSVPVSAQTVLAHAGGPATPPVETGDCTKDGW